MSGIATLLLHSGQKVSGSDLKESRITQELKQQGAEVFIGHNPANIKGASCVIYSSAIADNNPEMAEAKNQGIPLMRRAQALAYLMKDKTVITVTGSHGKTTTTSLVSCLLLEAGLLPTVAIGGILRNINTNACLGSGKFFVAEADESDGSFLYYHPRYSIVTNIDKEHLDYYKEFVIEVEAFRKFLNKTEDGGCVFCCADDLNLKQILKDYKKRHILFGLSDNADIYPAHIEMKGLSSEFNCFYKNKDIGRFYLALGGKHNISNALSVIALALELGIDLKVIRDTLANYKGAKRRLEIKFQDKDILLIDDYAHHPTEIMATLTAAKNLKKRRMVVAFQPHRYTRTKSLLNEFGRSFDAADYIIITDIYPAGEVPIIGISAKSIYDKIKEYSPDKDIHFLPKDKIVTHLLDIARPGDMLITLGAGDITRISDELVEGLKR